MEADSLREQLLALFLCYPRVALTLQEADCQFPRLHLPQGRSEGEALLRVFGSLDQALPLQATADAGRIEVRGFIAAPMQPPHGRAGRQLLYVNGHVVLGPQVLKLVAALQAQVLRGSYPAGHRAQRDALCHGQQAPPLLLRLTVPHGSYDVEIEDARPVATFLQWPLVCKAVLRGLAEVWRADVSEGMLRSVVTAQPGFAAAKAAAIKAAAARTAAKGVSASGSAEAAGRSTTGALAMPHARLGRSRRSSAPATPDGSSSHWDEPFQREPPQKRQRSSVGAPSGPQKMPVLPGDMVVVRMPEESQGLSRGEPMRAHEAVHASLAAKAFGGVSNRGGTAISLSSQPRSTAAFAPPLPQVRSASAGIPIGAVRAIPRLVSSADWEQQPKVRHTAHEPRSSARTDRRDPPSSPQHCSRRPLSGSQETATASPTAATAAEVLRPVSEGASAHDSACDPHDTGIAASTLISPRGAQAAPFHLQRQLTQMILRRSRGSSQSSLPSLETPEAKPLRHGSFDTTELSPHGPVSRDRLAREASYAVFHGGGSAAAALEADFAVAERRSAEWYARVRGEGIAYPQGPTWDYRSVPQTSCGDDNWLVLRPTRCGQPQGPSLSHLPEPAPGHLQQDTANAAGHHLQPRQQDPRQQGCQHVPPQMLEDDGIPEPSVTPPDSTPQRPLSLVRRTTSAPPHPKHNLKPRHRSLSTSGHAIGSATAFRENPNTNAVTMHTINYTKRPPTRVVHPPASQQPAPPKRVATATDVPIKPAVAPAASISILPEQTTQKLPLRAVPFRLEFDKQPVQIQNEATKQASARQPLKDVTHLAIPSCLQGVELEPQQCPDSQPPPPVPCPPAQARGCSSALPQEPYVHSPRSPRGNSPFLTERQQIGVLSDGSPSEDAAEVDVAAAVEAAAVVPCRDATLHHQPSPVGTPLQPLPLPLPLLCPVPQPLSQQDKQGCLQPAKQGSLQPDKGRGLRRRLVQSPHQVACVAAAACVKRRRGVAAALEPHGADVTHALLGLPSADSQPLKSLPFPATSPAPHPAGAQTSVVNRGESGAPNVWCTMTSKTAGPAGVVGPGSDSTASAGRGVTHTAGREDPAGDRQPLQALLDEWRNPARAAPPVSCPSVEGLLCVSGGAIRPPAVTRQDLENATVIGQFAKKFIVLHIASAGADGNGNNTNGNVRGRLAIMDQHAADERVRLEALQGDLLLPDGGPRRVTKQPLRPPHRLLVTEHEAFLLDRFLPAVAGWGWDVVRGRSDPNLISAPLIDGIALNATDLKMFLHLLEDTAGVAKAPPRVGTLLSSRACRSAVMFGDQLPPERCTALLRQLAVTCQFDICAHGRPTVATLIDLDVLQSVFPGAM